MRLNLNNVNAHLIDELVRTAAIEDMIENGFDIVLVRLPTGQKVAIHLVERDIDVPLIRQILERNARQDTYTLFILWAAMLLPEHGERYPPYDWMWALLALYGDKIYAFETDGPNVWIFPIYFDSIPAQPERAVRYGERAVMTRLLCEHIHTQSGYLVGQWQIAGFGEMASRKNRENAQTGTKQEAGPQPASGYRNPIGVYYAVLGLEADADRETVRRAYRQLALRYHPDLNQDEAAHQKMQALNTAYEQIMTFLGDET